MPSISSSNLQEIRSVATDSCPAPPSLLPAPRCHAGSAPPRHCQAQGCEILGPLSLVYCKDHANGEAARTANLSSKEIAKDDTVLA
uniref:Uncharacterized protein n=1 Tax=Arundo donax TaxID=35708 RepID=A0A0A9DEB1_ARUDO